ncbi:MAG TPA: hypothetical protein PLH27_11715 [bacterium]|nr:hypothetical protein [bacterium]HMW33533.1 hypothetical protein [bacterium]HMW37522.1 hypothetical protein [bacterium]HMY36238.1 hypothetical protein [bacterium]HMZ05310.1 hypothetical protein [bacterium]
MKAGQHANTMDVLVFEVGTTLYGIPIGQIDMLDFVKSESQIPAGNQIRHLLGFVSDRNPISQRSVKIKNPQPLRFIVEGIYGVFTLDVRRIADLPKTIGHQVERSPVSSAYISPKEQWDGRLVLLLDLQKKHITERYAA